MIQDENGGEDDKIIDVVFHSSYSKLELEKKQFKSYIKAHMKAIVKKMGETKTEEEIKAF